MNNIKVVKLRDYQLSKYVPEYIGSSVQFNPIQFIKAGLAGHDQLRNQHECMNTQSRITQRT